MAEMSHLKLFNYLQPSYFMVPNKKHELIVGGQAIHNLFWRRAAAYVIDVFLFYFTFFQMFMLIYLPKAGFGLDDISTMSEYVAQSPDAAFRFLMGLVGVSFVLLFYLAMFEKNFGTTIGKKVMGLSIEGKLDYKNAFARNLTKSIFLPLLPFDLMGVFIDGNKFTDKLTKTKVIYRNNLSLRHGAWF